MSSLRLALKQSLADAGGNALPSSDSEENEFHGDDDDDEEDGEKKHEVPIPPPSETTTIAPPTRPERRTASDVDWKVLPPSESIRAHSRSLSVETMRENITPGLRVKVKFDGSTWYGGSVSMVSKDKSKIRIHYDDGTDETEPFPDPDHNIVVDDVENGTHEADANAYLPATIKKTEPKLQKEESPREKAKTIDVGKVVPGEVAINNNHIAVAKTKEPTTPKRKETEAKPNKSVLKSPQQERPVVDGGGEVAKPAKRKRGRPRKHPLPPGQTTPSATAKPQVTSSAHDTPKSPKGVKKLTIRIPIRKIKQAMNTPTVPNINARISSSLASPGKSPTEKRKAKKRKQLAAESKPLPLIPEDNLAVSICPPADPTTREEGAASLPPNERINNGDPKHEGFITKKKKRRRNISELEQLDESWVRCDACGKWRIIPETAAIEENQNWYCSDNIHDPKRASCEVPEQTAKQVAKMNKRKRRMAAAEAENRIPDPAPEESITAVVKRGRGRPRRVKDPPGPVSAKPSSAAGELENLEWVQCEKCSKWRKIAPHISASDLPEVWTCDMNNWNPGSASCVAPEDKAEGLQDTGVFGQSGSSSESNKFTYRHLIFGSVGRRATRPISERTRAAESLFAVQYDEDEAPTKVLYADSSAFVSRGKQNLPLVDDTESVSVLEVMSKSRLWQDLRAASESFQHGVTPETTTSKMNGYFYDNLPPNIQQPMKEFILTVLGTDSLSSDAMAVKGAMLPTESLSESCKMAKPYFTLNVAVTTLYKLVKDGTVECVRKTNDFIPQYRRVVKRKPSARRVSRCMKIAKPWKRSKLSF